MEDKIRSLQEPEIKTLWNKYTNQDFDEYFKGKSKSEYVEEAKDILIKVFEERQRRRAERAVYDERENEINDIMNTPTLDTPKFTQPRRRKHITEDLASAIKKQYEKRENNMKKLRETYNNSFDAYDIATNSYGTTGEHTDDFSNG